MPYTSVLCRSITNAAEPVCMLAYMLGSGGGACVYVSAHMLRSGGKKIMATKNLAKLLRFFV